MKKIITFLFCFMWITFSATASNFEDEYIGSVDMKGNFLNGDLLLVEVNMEDMLSPILGTSFNLEYENEKLKFLRYEPGEFLETGGNPFYLVKDLAEKGSLSFGATLRSEDDFPLGGGRLVSFYFQIISGESFGFEFEKEVVSSLNTVRQDLDWVLWNDLFLEKNADIDSVSALDDLELELGNKGLRFFRNLLNPIVGIGTFSSILLLLAIIRLKSPGDKRPS